MSHIPNTIILEEIDDFLDDLDIPTYLREDVQSYYDKGDLEMTIGLVRNYKNVLNNPEWVNALNPKLA
jgi:hypothetical protein